MVILIIKTFARITDIMKTEAPLVDTWTTHSSGNISEEGSEKLQESECQEFYYETVTFSCEREAESLNHMTAYRASE